MSWQVEPGRGISRDERAAFQEAALRAPPKGGWGPAPRRVRGVRRQFQVRDVGG